ncbi:hypothetical protein WJX73_003475 [Symbiochloris irregularis]|uniref:Uncharacterized protein n=1 Tax=Symbiochloris irregularis TaxID=706552 RepID=A0AAW1PIJ9_9CHLO
MVGQPEIPAQKLDLPGKESEMTPRPDYGNSYKGSGKLKDKVALITGSDSGIGRAIAVHFAKEGAHIAIAYWKEHSDAEETKKVVEAEGVQTILIPGDLIEEAQCKKVVDETVKKFGRIDILVNNAAFQGPCLKSFTDIDRERLERTFNVNIIAYMSVAAKAVKHMAKGSAIINICSIQAFQPMAGILDYASTKGAITTFTKGAGAELISKGIRVNGIAPGPVWTPLVPSSFPEDMIDDFGAEMTPIKRAAQPFEYGPPAVFLAHEPSSSNIVACILNITGGMFM